MTDRELRAAALTTAARSGITLDTLAALLEHDHGLAAYCPACKRHQELDLPRLVSEGHGRRRLAGFRPRCRRCGGPGRIQVQAPAPSWPGGTMYVGPVHDR